MNILKVILDLLNGKKLNTGTIMILAVIVLQQLGIEKTEATTIATNIMMGIGGAMALWGYIHRLVKSRQVKTASISAVTRKLEP